MYVYKNRCMVYMWCDVMMGGGGIMHVLTHMDYIYVGIYTCVPRWAVVVPG